jgi:hypothetical protein
MYTCSFENCRAQAGGGGGGGSGAVEREERAQGRGTSGAGAAGSGAGTSGRSVSPGQTTSGGTSTLTPGGAGQTVLPGTPPVVRGTHQSCQMLNPRRTSGALGVEAGIGRMGTNAAGGIGIGTNAGLGMGTNAGIGIGTNFACASRPTVR